MTTNLPPPPPPVPGLRLPLRRRRLGSGAALSFLVHAGVIVLFVARGRELLAPGARGERSGVRGGGAGAVNFFALPASAPAEIAIPAAPHVTLSELPALRQIPVQLPPIDLPRVTLPPPLPAAASAETRAGAGGPGAGGPGAAAGGGAGADLGPGTGGEGGYIFVASPRTAILPPLSKVPGSVAGRTYRVRFWVSVEGRVTRVEVEPPITDAGYSREFQQRMLAYQFYPARTRDGRNVASVVLVPLRIGN